jgi:hypothetical protein
MARDKGGGEEGKFAACEAELPNGEWRRNDRMKRLYSEHVHKYTSEDTVAEFRELLVGGTAETVELGPDYTTRQKHLF